MRVRAARVFGVLLALSPFLVGAGYSAHTNYMLHCQGCHGADGVGELPNKVPPLLNSLGYFLQVPGGRAFLIQVPGVSQTPLGDQEIADLMNFVLRRYSESQLPDSFRPYSAKEVGAFRQEPQDVLSMREELVATIRDRLGVEIWTLEKPLPAVEVEVDRARGGEGGVDGRGD
jgi:hypothetical protein